MQMLMIKGHGDYYDDERVSLVAFSLFFISINNYVPIIFS